MTDTAFSKTLQREVDPEQYIQLLNLDESNVHAFARDDVICPICEVGGGSYVNASKGGYYRRKAHFRFNGENNESAHHPSCDFYNEHLSHEVSKHLIRFTTERAKITQVIRKLVCAAIQEEIFTQETMRKMRQWFFNKRVESTFKITLDIDQLEWLSYIAGLPVYPHASFRESLIPFHPVQATVPGFDWKKAILRETVRIHQPVLNKLAGMGIYRKQLEELYEHMCRTPKATLLDPALLQDEYGKTLQLTSFIVNNHIEFQNKAVRDKADGEQKLLAFSALLLFVSEWNIDKAIEKFAVIANVEEVNDLLAGNFIGLNPYYKISLANTAKALQDIWPVEFEEVEQWQVEKKMRDSYEEYSLSLSTPLPPLEPDFYVTNHLRQAEKEAEFQRMIESDQIDF